MREKNREASIASSRPSLVPLLSAETAMNVKAGLRRHLSASPLRTYTTLAARRLCALGNTFARFSHFAAESLKRRAMIDEKRAGMQRTERRGRDGRERAKATT